MKSKRPQAYSYLRMSTDLQRYGDSKRRQLKLSQAYARQHGLDLADDSRLEDIGVSAFKGANVKKDSDLGRFLDAIAAGKIEKGSYLLVESLDRISRQEVKKSLEIFLRIIGAGINIVTLADNHLYTEEKTEVTDLITSIIDMSRSNQESEIKSQRISAAWADKRARANSHKLTKWCPAWLKLTEDRTRYKVISARAKVVRSMFEDTIAGMGNYVITHRLNEKKVQTFTESNGWHSSYVAKILSNRAVIGEFQPFKKGSSGRRTPDGEPIRKYFPAIIDEEMFYRAQLGRSQRKVNGRGRKGAYVSNLFSGLATCAYCRSPMKFENKGPPPKGGTYLVCDGARRGLNCTSVRWRYDFFEASFLALVHQIDLGALVRNEDSKKRELEAEIDALRGEDITLVEEMEKAYELIRADAAVEFVKTKLKLLQEKKNEVTRILGSKISERQSLDATEKVFEQSKYDVKSLITELQSKNARDDIYRLRSLISARIKALVSTLNIAPAGLGPPLQHLVTSYKKQGETFAAEKLELKLASSEIDIPYFTVGFKDGSLLQVSPKPDDPLQFDSKIGAESGSITKFKTDGQFITHHSNRAK
jgi:DNA invertase Pin-like site-specific DNA recombinase